MLQRSPEKMRELREITIKTDTRDILSHATVQAEALEDYFLVDIDAHVTETQFWPEIIERIESTGATRRSCSSTASSRCTRCPSCITA